MQKYWLVVMTNPLEGREDEYNKWYEDQHLADVLKLPGVVAAQRLKLSDKQRAAPPYPWSYLAIYEVETNDIQVTIDTLKARAGTPEMPVTNAMQAGGATWVFQPITERLTAG